MTPTNNPRTKIRRSRQGCAECRRRHQRCDEAVPICSYCRGAGVTCVYTRNLNWGGRSFDKSRFGACRNKGSEVVQIASDCDGPAKDCDPTETMSSPTNLDLISDISKGQQEQEQHEVDSSGTLTGLQGRNVLPELTIVPVRFRPLLDYFHDAVSRSLSCHKGIQHDICSSLIPIAVQSSHLLAAVLCASACHRRSAGLEQSLDEIGHLRSTAIQSLNIALVCSDPRETEAALATTLVLCMSEIVSVEPQKDTWRLHLSGATALLRTLESGQENGSLNTSLAYMRRFYMSLKAIAVSCGMVEGTQFLDEPSGSGDYIDDLAGFSTSLLPIFDAINCLDMLEQKRVPIDPDDLIERVRQMLITRSSTLRSSLDLSEQAQTDFYLLDEAYHHMALLQLYQRSSQPSALAQVSIRRVISCISDMEINSGPCPAVAALPPLFTVGRAATSATDRARILKLLDTVWTGFGMGNVLATREYLERCWEEPEHGIGEKGNEAWGFLPY
ncbi:fungal-specific transcription factor domain-containing protein [Ilyonectria robusta]|uniref:fungal-specific transcription factor domain-containing protein n=1 Tax=Ilyonectria robusta TaxID=1079257 RepID=UPI001E8E6653|nr:fungal-specific transcription factor domain-containing protein [Ilyonectria robusta]KAH8649573.1 fungal-specific transcription factor domain-containing protein [Ilyonectria robusta]